MTIGPAITPAQQGNASPLNAKTKEAADTKISRELTASGEPQCLLKLMGDLQWDRSFDYKVERSRE